MSENFFESVKILSKGRDETSNTIDITAFICNGAQFFESTYKLYNVD